MEKLKCIPRYSIDLYGNVFDTIKKEKRTQMKLNGYMIVCLIEKKGVYKTKYIHRLLLETYMPTEGSDRLVVNHINGIKTDNTLSNLEWCTMKENIQHSWRIGLSKPHSNSVRKGRRCMVNGVEYQTVREAVEKTGILQSTISKIIKNASFSKTHTAIFLE